MSGGINSDSDEIYEITIDGSDVSEVTVDGVAAWLEAHFEVHSISAPSAVDKDESFTVSATVENINNGRDTQTISYNRGGSTTETLVGGQSTGVSFSDSISNEGTYTLSILSDDDSDSTSITVESVAPDSIDWDDENETESFLDGTYHHWDPNTNNASGIEELSSFLDSQSEWVSFGLGGSAGDGHATSMVSGSYGGGSYYWESDWFSGPSGDNSRTGMIIYDWTVNLSDVSQVKFWTAADEGASQAGHAFVVDRDDELFFQSGSPHSFTERSVDVSGYSGEHDLGLVVGWDSRSSTGQLDWGGIEYIE